MPVVLNLIMHTSKSQYIFVDCRSCGRDRCVIVIHTDANYVHWEPTEAEVFYRVIGAVRVGGVLRSSLTRVNVVSTLHSASSFIVAKSRLLAIYVACEHIVR